MKLVSPHDYRERILVYGGAGMGKTHDWFNIAKHTPDHVQFHVLDSDMTVRVFLAGETFGDLRDRIHVYEVFEWQDVREAVDKLVDKRGNSPLGEDDWLVFDRLDPYYDWAQAFISTEGRDMDPEDVWLQHVKDHQEKNGKVSATPYDPNTDWKAIKATYQRVQRAILRCPGHVFGAAAEKSVHGQYDGKAIHEKYDIAGLMKPDGEKQTPHLFHTELHRSPRHRLTAVKERVEGRELLQRVTIEDFAKEYLLKRGGWLPVSSS